MVAHERLTSLRVERVTDADDPRLDGYRRLTDPALRRHDRFVAESREVVRRLLDGHRHRLMSLLLGEAALDDLRDGLAACRPAPEILVADGALLRAVAGFPFHRGCLALAERGHEPSCDDVLAGLAPEATRLLVVDDVTDPNNVGALFRNAAAFGAGAVLLTARSGDPLYRKTIRVSMGQSLCLPWARLPSWPEAANRLRSRGFVPVALSPEGEDLERFVVEVPARIALVVGNEGAGMSSSARATCERSVGIRMRRGVDSLNVATAAAIALHRLSPGAPEQPPH
jgi:tRNA G18 (ribose-2'-O)-methylase SpoU